MKENIKPGIIYTNEPVKIQRGIIWYKPITDDIDPGVKPYYAVSDIGTVESKSSGDWKELKPIKDKDGYEYISLTNLYSRSKNYHIHKLVAMSFIENSNTEKNQINHIDGNKSNNDYSNLEWVSMQENIEHAVVTGLRNRTLNDSQIIFIANKLVNGLCDSEIFELFNKEYPESNIQFNKLCNSIRDIKCKNIRKDLLKDYEFPSRRDSKFSDEQILFVADQLLKGISDVEIFNIFNEKYPEMELTLNKIKNLTHGMVRHRDGFKGLIKDYDFPNRRYKR